jgi:hypothetical protein
MEAYIMTLLMAKDILIIVSARSSGPSIDSMVTLIPLLVLVPVIAKPMLLPGHLSEESVVASSQLQCRAAKGKV